MSAPPVNAPYPSPARRHALRGLGSLVAGAWMFGAAPAWAAGFGFDDVAREAQTLAQSPWRKPPPLSERRANLEYDDYRKLRHRPDRALWRSQKLPFQMQFFTTGRGNARALRLHEIVDGKAQPLIVRNADFDFEGVLNEPAQAEAPIAGWRVTYPLHRADKQDEVAVFLGASYFRALGAGPALRPVGARPGHRHRRRRRRGVPRCAAFWFERPQPGAREFTFYALLDGPRVAGAYRFVVTPGNDTTVDVQARLFLRAPVATLGIAPLTSMFLHGENQPAATATSGPRCTTPTACWSRPRDGEWLWRPLTNPNGTFVTSFGCVRRKGFGLMQRDRAFASYEDVEARYERRPSAWIEPDRRLGRRAASSCCSSARPTRRTTTSPPTGCRPPAPPGEPLDLA